MEWIFLTWFFNFWYDYFCHSCYATVFLLSDGKVNRGCLSDDEKIATACIGGSENCLTCNGDGCNDEVMNHSSKASPTTLLIVTIIAIFALFIEWISGEEKRGK